MEPETALSESARSRIEEALAANQTYDGDLPDWLDGWSAEGTVETGIPGDIGMMLRGENADSVQRWAEREDCLLNAFYAYWHSGLFNHADRLLGERDEVKKAILPEGMLPKQWDKFTDSYLATDETGYGNSDPRDPHNDIVHQRLEAQGGLYAESHQGSSHNSR